MTHLQGTKIAHFDALLEAREARLSESLRQPLEQIISASSDPTHEVWDFKDAASQESELAISESQAGRSAIELKEVQDARQRIRQGSFGLCCDCGEPVDLARLMAVPATRFCLNCQSRHEKQP
ncbi:MAG: TraR/DksA family transcriptional regulator [Pseudomonadota bacterium]